MNISELWQSKHEEDWNSADASYIVRVRRGNRVIDDLLETRLQLVRQLGDIKRLQLGDNWYDFFLQMYFRWKYTAPNRYSTTTKLFQEEYCNNVMLLDRLVLSILTEADRADTELMTFKANRIHGLGFAGASGLLALLFPDLYGTVDQFAVKNLRSILGLPQHLQLLKIREQGLRLSDIVLITTIYRTKSTELNELFQTNRWNPRRIDRVLWASRDAD